MPATINAAIVAKAKADARPGAKRYEVSDSRAKGLVLRVGPSGAVWQFRYAVDKRDVRLAIGDVDTWTIAEARDLVVRGQAMLRDRSGLPNAEWIERMLVRTGKIAEATMAPAPEKPRDVFRWTFEQGRAAFLYEMKRTKSPVTAADYRQKICAAEFEPFQKRPLPTIARTEMAGVVGKIHRSGRETHAANTARVISAAWSWFEKDQQISDAGVIPGVMRGLKAPERTRRPSKRMVADPTLEDLGRVIAIARSGAIDPIIGCAVEFVVWSVQRRRAVASAKIEDFRPLDGDEEGLWYVYADDRKRSDGDAHVVPLPAAAWACVKRAVAIVEADWQGRLASDPDVPRPEYLFPQTRARRRGMPLTHLNPSTLTHAMGFMPGVTSSPHHVRAIFGTYGERILGFSRPTTRLILDHSEGGTRSDVTGRHYSLHDGTHEKWPVMRKWAAAIDADVARAIEALEPVDELKLAIAAARYGEA
ncbi:MAG: integrase family protein [Devosia sp.]|uniref:integrase family protein n=1 Tax=Devosia sp. TaxID=1871048 RepID=UPI0024C6E189|nr:integrase family protein [Devosia sp.]UYO00175.1 MAG: integrase family protein [Devosia sp.]